VVRLIYDQEVMIIRVDHAAAQRFERREPNRPPGCLRCRKPHGSKHRRRDHERCRAFWNQSKRYESLSRADGIAQESTAKFTHRCPETTHRIELMRMQRDLAELPTIDSAMNVEKGRGDCRAGAYRVYNVEPEIDFAYTDHSSSGSTSLRLRS